LFRQLHDQSRVLWDDTTQNNQYLIEIQKLNNKIMLRAKVLQWACHRSEAEPHCTFDAAAGSKNLSLVKKAPLALRSETPIHVMFWGQYDEKFLCGI
jgi:hypothetical protein